jgi:hypothetical protein
VQQVDDGFCYGNKATAYTPKGQHEIGDFAFPLRC